MHVCLSCCNEPVSLGLARHGPVWSNLVAEGFGRDRKTKSTAETRDVKRKREDVKTDAIEEQRVSERESETLCRL